MKKYIMYIQRFYITIIIWNINAWRSLTEVLTNETQKSFHSVIQDIDSTVKEIVNNEES